MYQKANNSMTVQMPASTKAESYPRGNPVPGGTTARNGIPSAIQQPAIQGAVMGTDAMGQQSFPQVSTVTPATSQLMPVTDTTQPAPMTADSLEFLNGFLRTQIGRRVKVEFLIGTNTFTDKTGLLIGVGANYILLRESSSDDVLTCDFFNIKFVTIYY
jgi:hypothetical protein